MYRHLNVFSSQFCTLPPAYLFQKDERALPGKLHSRKRFCLSTCNNKGSASYCTPFLFSCFFVLFSRVTLQLHCYCTAVTLQLLRSYTTATPQLHYSYTAIIPQLHYSYSAVTLHLHCYYTAVTLQLLRSYTAIIPQLHYSYSAVTLQLHCYYTAVTLQLHCYYTAVTLQLHCYYTVITLQLLRSSPWLTERSPRYLCHSCSLDAAVHLRSHPPVYYSAVQFTVISHHATL